MAKNFNYDDFNKPQKQTRENFRPLLMAVIAIFGIGYLLVYRVYFASQPGTGSVSENTAVTSVSENYSDTGKNSENSDALSDIYNSSEDSDSQDSSNETGTSDSEATESQTSGLQTSSSQTSKTQTPDAASDKSSDKTSGNTENVTPSDISTGTSSYTKDTKTNRTETVMYTDDRTTYQDGFFYQPITNDIKERIYGLSYKTDCTIPYEDLRYISVMYYDFNNQVQTGEIICNKAIAQDLVEIFYELYCNEYQIDKIRLVDEYQADDDLSCADNNTSCFNFRTVDGTSTLSKHAQGLAIDINPFQNPYVTYPNGKERISPAGSEPYADRSSGLPHIITENDLCYRLFTAHGFTWGGHWKTLKDYQHFQKAL